MANVKEHILNHIKEHFSNTYELQREYRSHPGYSKIEIPNFLPLDIVRAMALELDNLPLEQGKKFTRNGSCMYEYNNLDITPIQDEVIHALHSSTFLKWLQEVTDTVDLIPDPHLVGAGYAKAFNGDSLKIHSDFNWNDQLRLHRRLSFIIYLNEDWKEKWGGSLDFYDTNRKDVISSVVPGPGNLVIWSYDNLAFHGYPDPMKTPTGVSRKNLRLFYYVSNAQHDDKFPPHRSLYWYDNEEGVPYDKPWEK